MLFPLRLSGVAGPTLLSLVRNCNWEGNGSTTYAGPSTVMTGELGFALAAENAATERMPPRTTDIRPEMERTELLPSFSLSSTVTRDCFAFSCMEHLCGRANRPKDGLGCQRPAWRSFFAV